MSILSLVQGSGFVVPSACAKSGVETMMKSLGAEWGRYIALANPPRNVFLDKFLIIFNYIHSGKAFE